MEKRVLKQIKTFFEEKKGGEHMRFDSNFKEIIIIYTIKYKVYNKENKECLK